MLSSVFDENNAQHREFRPVLDYIQKNRGKLAYGGTKYLSELKRATRFFGIIVELERARKAFKLDSGEVDAEEKRVKRRLKTRGCNDHHIIAIVIVGRCSFVCTNDKRFIPESFSKTANL